MLTFDHYLTPATLEDAFDALERIPGARIVAGATDLLPWAREGRAGDVHLPALVDISRIPQLQGVSVERGRVHMGAATPIAAFQNDPLLQRHAPVLGCCAVWFADDQIREQATVGGNLVNASPAGDSQPALLAMNAGVTLARREGGQIARAYHALVRVHPRAGQDPAAAARNHDAAARWTRCRAMGRRSRKSGIAGRW